MPLIATAGLIATVSATLPVEAGGIRAVLRRGPVRTDVAVEVAVVQHIEGVPLGGQLQLRIDLDVVGAAGLVLNGVDVGDHAVVEPLVVGLRGGRTAYAHRWPWRTARTGSTMRCFMSVSVSGVVRGVSQLPDQCGAQLVDRLTDQI